MWGIQTDLNYIVKLNQSQGVRELVYQWDRKGGELILGTETVRVATTNMLGFINLVLKATQTIAFSTAPALGHWTKGPVAPRWDSQISPDTFQGARDKSKKTPTCTVPALSLNQLF